MVGACGRLVPCSMIRAKSMDRCCSGVPARFRHCFCYVSYVSSQHALRGSDSRFIWAAEEAGMTDDEITDLVDFLAENPTAGSVIRGTGGCRKVRVAGRGRGKSGGYRTITFYSGEDLPVF